MNKVFNPRVVLVMGVPSFRAGLAAGPVFEQAVNLDDCAARNREPHHHERPPVGHDDNPRGAIDERRNLDGGRLRGRDRRPRHVDRATTNERECTTLFSAIRSLHHVGI
jgi:hypothetical protein